MLAVSENDASAVLLDKPTSQCFSVTIQPQRCSDVLVFSSLSFDIYLVHFKPESERVVPFQTVVEFRTLSLCLIKCRHTFFHISLVAVRGGGRVSQGALLTDKTESSAFTVHFMGRDKCF